jgi:hypothetical protein
MMEDYWAKGNEYWPETEYPYWPLKLTVLLRGAVVGNSETPDVTLLPSRVIRDVTEFVLSIDRLRAFEVFIDRVREFDVELDL